jgi:hypothetical protein
MATKSEIQAAAYRAEAIARPFTDAAERSAPVSKTGEAQSGMRTERVTLECVHSFGKGPREWDWWQLMELRPGESVRVVEEAVGSVDDREYADRIGCDEERDFANRIIAQRDAAIRELSAEKLWRDCVVMQRNEIRDERDALKARVAALEARTSTAGEGSCDAPDASGGGQQNVRDGTSSDPAGDRSQNGRIEAASGRGGEGGGA